MNDQIWGQKWPLVAPIHSDSKVLGISASIYEFGGRGGSSQCLKGSCNITWGLVRNTDPQVLPETYGINACV